ncbi:hypothetical protein MWK40_26235 [Escherichia coli]|nr:hypothetical protein [Escherichia coli]
MINFIIALRKIYIAYLKSILYIMRLLSWLSLPAADIRQRMSALQAKLKLILPLSEDLSNIRIGDNKNHNKLLKLSNKYKEWQFTISDLTSDN